MNTRQSWIIGAAIVIGCLILTFFNGRQSAAEPPKAEHSALGRYQLQLSVQGINSHVVVLDSQTGHCWLRYIGGTDVWTDLGSPVRAGK
jgi:hypothetical protein